ncbi:hydroxypyruvate isomerase [Streptomyces sp. NBRC 110611]|nr:hydroxypyruvate isomerase [Streptomyces sp. NBRC 110611]
MAGGWGGECWDSASTARDHGYRGLRVLQHGVGDPARAGTRRVARAVRAHDEEIGTGESLDERARRGEHVRSAWRSPLA